MAWPQRDNGHITISTTRPSASSAPMKAPPARPLPRPPPETEIGPALRPTRPRDDTLIGPMRTRTLMAASPEALLHDRMAPARPTRTTAGGRYGTDLWCPCSTAELRVP